MQKYFVNTVKKSKQFYFTRFFQENIKKPKNMWSGIKIPTATTVTKVN